MFVIINLVRTFITCHFIHLVYKEFQKEILSIDINETLMILL